MAADFDGDGRADVASDRGRWLAAPAAQLTVTKNHWLLAGLNGVKNPKLAPCAKVEIKTGSSYQKRIYAGVPLLFGVDSYKLGRCRAHHVAERADPERDRSSRSTSRIEYPGSAAPFRVLPDDLHVGWRASSASSPTCWAWRRWARHRAMAATSRWITTNTCRFRARRSQAVNGRYEVRITEELREVSYLDQVKLIAVDHPAATEIFTNEKFKSPPFPEFRLFGVKQRDLSGERARRRRPRRAAAAAASRPHAIRTASGAITWMSPRCTTWIWISAKPRRTIARC